MSAPRRGGTPAAGEDDFGIYVHLPYCRHVCPYCDFNVYVNKRARYDELAVALERELELRAELFAGREVRSIYFGGGTPSLAPAALLERVLAAIRRRFVVDAGAELTLEMDPGTLDAAGLRERRRLGINRLSLGWQSSHDALLRTLGRAHDAADGLAAFAAARAEGYDNVSIDLIFAVPGQTLAHLEQDLDAVLRLGPEHVSLYALTFHEGTTFHRRRAQGRLVPAPEELEVEMMQRIEARLVAAGYVHYEVSNYARPGALSRHNSLYWAGAPYLGLGPGAHSFWREGWRRGRRWEGRREPGAHFAAFAQATAGPLAADATVEWLEELTPRQLLSERLLVGLRRSAGVDLARLELGEHAAEIEAAAGQAVARGWVERRGSLLVPTAAGLLQADALAELFF